MNRSVLSGDALARALELRDLSDPAQGPHAMQLVVDALVAAVRRAWPETELVVHRGERVVDVTHNYDRLGYGTDAITRDARYTRYVDSARMLRSHTSSMIPRLLEEVARSDARDCVLVCPGIVYRRDAIDRLHCGEPHQIDIWRIRRHDGTGDPLRLTDLRALVDTVAAAALPQAVVRVTHTTHPYTLDGLEILVRLGAATDWIEIGECGLAHPDVLARAGLDAHGWSGLAMGLGLDRLLMLDKGIDDIRLLRDADVRIAAQMLDRSPYRRTSDQPPIRRDLSVVVDTDDSIEDMGDRVRLALGDDAEMVEEVTALSQTLHAELPDAARQRLQLAPTQKNVLVRVVLRHVSRTLTNHEANALRDRIYAAIHRGAISEWANRER